MAVEGLRRDFLPHGVKERKAESLSLSLSVSSSHAVPVLVSAVMLKAARCVFDCLCRREAGLLVASRVLGGARLSLRLTFNKFVQQSVKHAPSPTHQRFYDPTRSSNG